MKSRPATAPSLHPQENQIGYWLRNCEYQLAASVRCRSGVDIPCLEARARRMWIAKGDSTKDSFLKKRALLLDATHAQSYNPTMEKRELKQRPSQCRAPENGFPSSFTNSIAHSYSRHFPPSARQRGKRKKTEALYRCLTLLSRRYVSFKRTRKKGMLA